MLIRFMSFDHIPPGEPSSSRSLPFILEDRDARPSSWGEGEPFGAELCFVVGESLGLLLPSKDVSSVIDLRAGLDVDVG